MICRVSGGKIGGGKPACMHAPVVAVIVSRCSGVYKAVSRRVRDFCCVPAEGVRVESGCLKVCNTRA